MDERIKEFVAMGYTSIQAYFLEGVGFTKVLHRAIGRRFGRLPLIILPALVLVQACTTLGVVLASSDTAEPHDRPQGCGNNDRLQD